jgi:hypothetical protein
MNRKKSELKKVNIIPDTKDDDMTSNKKIIEVAELMKKIDQHGCDTNDMEVLQDGLAMLGPDNQVIVRVAFRLMLGEACCIKSNSLEIFNRYRSLANDLGATVEDGTSTTAKRVYADMADGRAATALMAITILPPEADDDEG